MSLRPALLLLLAVELGCGRDRGQWSIVVDNKSASPCDVAVTMEEGRAKGGASAGGVKPGESLTLIVGPASTVVESVKVAQNGKEETFTPKTAIQGGDRYWIVVSPDGKASGVVEKE
jgi:hypothetical protein